MSERGVPPASFVYRSPVSEFPPDPTAVNVAPVTEFHPTFGVHSSIVSENSGAFRNHSGAIVAVPPLVRNELSLV